MIDFLKNKKEHLTQLLKHKKQLNEVYQKFIEDNKVETDEDLVKLSKSGKLGDDFVSVIIKNQILQNEIINYMERLSDISYLLTLKGKSELVEELKLDDLPGFTLFSSEYIPFKSQFIIEGDDIVLSNKDMMGKAITAFKENLEKII